MDRFTDSPQNQRRKSDEEGRQEGVERVRLLGSIFRNGKVQIEKIDRWEADQGGFGRIRDENRRGGEGSHSPSGQT